MTIINKDLLESKIKEHDLIAISVSSVEVTNIVSIDVKSIDDFLSVVDRINPTYVYYKYEYYDKEDYIIPLDYYSEYPQDFKKVIRDHNKLIKDCSFDRPKYLMIFVLLNGTFLGVSFEDDWLTEQDIFEKDEQIEIIESDFHKEVYQIKEITKLQKKNDMNTLRQIIINDDEFKYKKNQDLRQSYLIDLLEREDMKKYVPLFMGDYRLDRTLIKMFMDETWMIYQENKKKQ